MDILDKIDFIDESTNDYKVWDVFDENKRKTSSAVLFTDGEYFLAVHPSRSAGNYWDLPKGGVDELENPDAAAVREFYEEVGIRIDKSKLEFMNKISIHEGEKDVLIYLYVVEKLAPISIMHCDSMTTAYGTPIPEVNKYKYILLKDHRKLRPAFHNVMRRIYSKLQRR